MRTNTRAVVAGGVITAVALGYGAMAMGTSTTKAPRASFGTPVVVDFFRPGYEPDAAIARAGDYKGSTYVSVPNGFSTTMSYLWRSDDNRRSFHMTEGNALGKQATCIGGGDTELQLDPVSGDVYFNDLQGLTNFTNSRSTDGGHTWETSCTSVNGVGVDRQWIGIDSNGGRSAVGSGPNAGRLYFDYDNIERSGASYVGTGNQLVMNTSIDGVHYGSKCVAAHAPCLLPPAVITHNEVIPGNIVVDNVRGSRFQHRVYAIHTGDGGSSVVMSYCSGKKGDHTAAQVADSCTDPTAIKGSDPKNIYWHDSFVRKQGPWSTGQLFPAVSMDTKGNLYAVWSEYPGAGVPSGPGAIKLAVSTDGAQHWSKPITVSPKGLKNDVMPWIVAGSPGRIGVAWYGSTTGSKKDSTGVHYGPDPVDQAYWDLYYATSINALGKHTFGTTKVSDHHVKYGDISTGGLGGSQDRSLGDFFQVQMGQHGEAVITYVDDTSADRNADTCAGCGETPAEAAGPVMVVSQNGGPSLLAGKRVPRFARPIGRVQDKPGDAFLAVAGQDVKAPGALDVIGASVRKRNAKTLTISLSTNDRHLAQHLATTPPLGGPTNTWMVRWAAPSYHKVGDGNMFYVGMASTAGGAPSFYTGTTQAITTTHAKYFTYPATHAIKGVIQGGTITWTLPLRLVDSPKKGQGMFSITGFTATQATPPATQTLTIPNQGGELGDFNIPNLISASSPFTYYIGR